MTERINFAPEQQEHLLPAAEQELELPEHAGETFAELPHEKAEKIEAVRQEVQEIQKTAEQAQLPSSETTDSELPTYVSRDMKQASKQQTLKHVRSQLPAPARALSHVIHQPAIRVASEIGSRTVSRPSGVLGGGLFAFLGSLIYLYFTKHIGLPYNYLLFLVFFVGGFVVGLIIELALRVVRPRTQE